MNVKDCNNKEWTVLIFADCDDYDAAEREADELGLLDTLYAGTLDEAVSQLKSRLQHRGVALDDADSKDVGARLPSGLEVSFLVDAP